METDTTTATLTAAATSHLTSDSSQSRRAVGESGGGEGGVGGEEKAANRLGAQNHSTMLNTILNDLNLKQQQQQQINKTVLLDGDLINGTSSSKPKNSLFHVKDNAAAQVSPSTRISALNYIHDALRKVTVSALKSFSLFSLLNFQAQRNAEHNSVEF